MSDIFASSAVFLFASLLTIGILFSTPFNTAVVDKPKILDILPSISVTSTL